MDSLLLIPDSFANADTCVRFACDALSSKMSVYEIIFNTTNILCTIINVVLVYYIYKQGNSRDDDKTERQRKREMFQTLILNNNIKAFYDFYYNLIEVSNQLLTPGLSLEEKQNINDKILEFGTIFRIEFVDSLNAIDESLYNKMITKYDTLVDGITNTIFDEGINLSHRPKFEELITSGIFVAKTQMLKLLFNYNG